MSKILVILTGGTIGSRIKGEVIDVSSASPYRLLAAYREKYGEGQEFEVIQPLNLLSENMTPETILVILKTLEKTAFENYDGVIITHGSDTLSYTAAFVGLLFHHVPVPVVLVASNHPQEEEGSNGLNNFAGAVELIRQGTLRGVFVLYQDDQGINQIYLATRLVEADPFLDQFRDFARVPFGRIERGSLILNPGSDRAMREEMRKSESLPVPDSFSKKILLIRPYPGMDYSVFDFKEENRPAAVLHLLYHSSTACLAEGNYSFLLFARRCRELGIDVYMASHKRLGGNRYVTGDMLLKEGIVPLLNISPESAYAKLMLLYNTEGICVPEKIGQTLYFENVEDAQK